jgi:hypothetical protein
MANTDRKQHYLALNVVSREPMDWEEHVVGLLSRHCSAEEGGGSLKPCKTIRLMLATPSGLEPAFETTGIERNEKICSVALREQESMRIRQEFQAASGPLHQIGIDLPLHRTDYWNPAEAIQPLFGNRDAAHRLMAVPQSGERFDVNVVIIDQGVSRSLIEDCRGVFGGGWKVENGPTPGATRGGHGSMLARNILGVAPGATIFDLPVIPADITNVPVFLSDAHDAFGEMLASIEGLRAKGDPRWRRPWVLVNAWAAFNLGEEHPRGKPDGPKHPLNYSDNPKHPLNIIVGEAASKHDIVFAAGNCGQFGSMARCGVHDVGPGRSILGANSHPGVLTIGAVRTDGLWLGYSSQGPGALDPYKPDLCAASQFSENEDAFAGNTGTSAACALAAGVVARLRGKRDSKPFSPSEMKRVLIDTAFGRVEQSRWDNQLGNGIINYTEAAKKA